MDKVEIDKQLIVLSEIANKYRNKEKDDIEGYNTNPINSLSAPIEENIIKYNTNLLEQTCSCKDWTIKRKDYNYNDPRRFCKHLIFLLKNDKLDENLIFFKEDFEYYKKQKKGYKLNFEDIFHIPNTDYKIQVNYERDWMNIFHKNGLRYGILFNEYNEIYWANEPSKPDDFKVVESFLTDLLIGNINELTQTEKHMIQDKISTQITEYYEKYRNKNYIVYGVNWDDDEYGEELHWSYIVVNQDIIYFSLNGKELHIIRNKENHQNTNIQNNMENDDYNPDIDNQEVVKATSQANSYYYGLGNEIQDYNEALKYYLKAIKLGSIESYNIVANMYLNGEGVKKDYQKALSYFKEGSKKGDNSCYWQMATIFESIKSIDNARKSWKKYFTSTEVPNEFISIFYLKFALLYEENINYLDKMKSVKQEIISIFKEEQPLSKIYKDGNFYLVGSDFIDMLEENI